MISSHVSVASPCRVAVYQYLTMGYDMLCFILSDVAKSIYIHDKMTRFQVCQTLTTPGDRDGRFVSKVGQIGPKWDKSGAFSDQISVHLARGRQMH